MSKILFKIGPLKIGYNNCFIRRLIKKLALGFLKSDAETPIYDKSYFYTYRSLPRFAAEYNLVSEICSLPKTAIVVQGPVLSKHDFTFETLLFYKKVFQQNNLDIRLIFSTWHDETPAVLERIRALGIEVVLSDSCPNGANNLNRQIVTTRAGLLRAKELGCEYVLKTRADQRIYAPNLLTFLFNLQKIFPLDKTVRKLRQRLIALSFNSFKYRLYGVSDMFLFGHIDDVLAYWDIPLNLYCPQHEGKSAEEIFKNESPETFICRRFLRRIGFNPTDSQEDTDLCYARFFCLIDKESIDLYWPKYTNAERRWEKFEPYVMEEMSFRDWLNLYCKHQSLSRSSL